MSLPKLMSVYEPSAWVVIRFKTEDEEVYKVMGGWYGGYLCGDSWRLNSGIEKVIDKGDTYEFVGASGSVYICNKENERMSGYMAAIFDSWKKIDKEIGITVVNAKEYYELT